MKQHVPIHILHMDRNDYPNDAELVRLVMAREGLPIDWCRWERSPSMPVVLNRAGSTLSSPVTLFRNTAAWRF